jgi:hypothetical protein
MSHPIYKPRPLPRNQTPAERFAKRIKSRAQFERALAALPDERIRELVRREVEPLLPVTIK